MAEVALPWLERKLTDKLIRKYAELGEGLNRGRISEEKAEEHFYELINQHYEDFSAKLSSTPPANKILAFVEWMLHHATAMMMDGLDQFWTQEKMGGVKAAHALIRATSRLLEEKAVPDDRNIHSKHLAENVEKISQHLLFVPQVIAIASTDLENLMDPHRAREVKELASKVRNAPNSDAAQYYAHQIRQILASDKHLDKEIRNRLKKLSPVLQDLFDRLGHITMIAFALTGHEKFMNWLASYSTVEFLHAKNQERIMRLGGMAQLLGLFVGRPSTTNVYKAGAERVAGKLENYLKYLPPSIRPQYEAALKALRKAT